MYCKVGNLSLGGKERLYLQVSLLRHGALKEQCVQREMVVIAENTHFASTVNHNLSVLRMQIYRVLLLVKWGKKSLQPTIWEVGPGALKPGLP